MSDIVPNKNAPGVRFIRKNGRVIPIFSGNRHGVKPRVAANLVEQEVHNLSDKVDQAQKGERHHQGYGTDHRVIGSKSSFPSWYSESGFKNKTHFKEALNKPSVYQQRLLDIAVSNVKKSDQGLKFEVATRQVFDNSGVQFRKIDGKIRPIRVQKSTSNKRVSDWDFEL